MSGFTSARLERLREAMGLGAVFAPPGTVPIQVAEAELDHRTASSEHGLPRNALGLGLLHGRARGLGWRHRRRFTSRAFRGGYGWDGGTGTTRRTDPASGLTGVLLTQRAMTSPELPKVFIDFWSAAYNVIH